MRLGIMKVQKGPLVKVHSEIVIPAYWRCQDCGMVTKHSTKAVYVSDGKSWRGGMPKPMEPRRSCAPDVGH